MHITTGTCSLNNSHFTTSYRNPQVFPKKYFQRYNSCQPGDVKFSYRFVRVISLSNTNQGDADHRVVLSWVRYIMQNSQQPIQSRVVFRTCIVGKGQEYGLVYTVIAQSYRDPPGISTTIISAVQFLPAWACRLL